LLSVGGHLDKHIILWEWLEERVVGMSKSSRTLHCGKFYPYGTHEEFVTVGEQAITFWLLYEGKQLRVRFFNVGYVLITCKQVQEGDIPSAFLKRNPKLNFTSLTFSMNNLFVGSSQGDILVWNMQNNTCLFSWQACPFEIGITNSSDVDVTFIIDSILCLGNELIAAGASPLVRKFVLQEQNRKMQCKLRTEVDVGGHVKALSASEDAKHVDCLFYYDSL
jgi:hypothetical protein